MLLYPAAARYLNNNCFTFFALCERKKRKTENRKYLAAAGKNHIEAGNYVSPVNKGIVAAPPE